MITGPGRPAEIQGVLFDLDGVLTDTAAVHRHAWAALFDDYLSGFPDKEPYTEQDYFDHLDGVGRARGVANVLGSRGIELPMGAGDDAAGDASVNALGNRKNDEFGRLLAEEGVQAFPGSVRLVDVLESAATPMGVVSSSQNANAVLTEAGLAERFAVVVDGTVAEAAGLAGKPAPDMFLHAARALGVEPAQTLVFEDAVSGVAAARAGGFWVIGVDRGAGEEALRAAGADEVVGDVGDLVAALTAAGDVVVSTVSRRPR